MAAAEYPSLMHRWFQEVWNEGNEATIDELYAIEGSVQGADGRGDAVSFGPPEFKEIWKALRKAFADINWVVHDVITAPCPSGAGTMQAARWSVRMRHVGEFEGRPASGREVTVTGMSFCLLSDGQIIKGWNNWDLHGLMEQISAATS